MAIGKFGGFNPRWGNLNQQFETPKNPADNIEETETIPPVTETAEAGHESQEGYELRKQAEGQEQQGPTESEEEIVAQLQELNNTGFETNTDEINAQRQRMGLATEQTPSGLGLGIQRRAARGAQEALRQKPRSSIWNQPTEEEKPFDKKAYWDNIDKKVG